MSILDTVFRRREPAVKYRTTDGGHPAPYPDMTDEQLYNYEMTFNVPKKTFDRRPADAAPPAGAATGRTGPHGPRERTQAEESAAVVSRTSGPRTAGGRTAPSGASSRTRPGASPAAPQDGEFSTTRTAVREPVVEPLLPTAPLDLSKPVRTVTTRQPVEIITTRARHPLFKVLGYIGDDQVVTMFTLDGQISENGPRFLENVPQRQSLYLNIYLNRAMGGRERFFLTQHETKEAADAAATVERITCIPVEFDL